MSGDLDAQAADVALRPLRQALLAAAGAEADRIVRAAQDEAARTLAEASAQAHEVVEQGRREGRSDATAVLAAERSRTHRQARALVLAAQRAAYDDLRAAVRQEATTLPEDTAWPDLRDRLAAHARRLLGPDAELVEVPGGLRARSGSRTVDLTVSSLAEAELVALGPEVEKLWVP